MSDIVRREVRQIAPYNSGLTIAEVQEKYNVTRIAKLGSNENPIGPSQRVRASLCTASSLIHLYPDPAGRGLKARLSEMLGRPETDFILGNGSEDLISVICRTVVRAGDKVVTPFPSFQLHEDYAAL